MIEKIERILRIDLNESPLVKQAFHHSSYVNEHPSSGEDNENLEFLGDAVLGLLVAELLYDNHPEESEGFLSKTRSAIVSREPLAKVARSLGLGGHLKLGKGELANGGADKDSLLSNALEALWGALYKEVGFEEMRALTKEVFSEELSSAMASESFDAKTALQEILQAEGDGTPEYVIVSEEGPAHQKRFVAEVRWREKTLGKAEGTSKKRAEQNAAMIGLKKMQP